MLEISKRRPPFFERMEKHETISGGHKDPTQLKVLEKSKSVMEQGSIFVCS
jgi:hypothetical protein